MLRLKSQPGEESSLTSGGSITSETSSSGFRPVPKKRMFLSRKTSGVSEISGRGSDTLGGSVAAVPVPRQSTERGSSVGEAPHLVSQPAQLATTQTAPSQQPLAEPHQAASVSSSEWEQRTVAVARDRSVDLLHYESHQEKKKSTVQLKLNVCPLSDPRALGVIQPSTEATCRGALSHFMMRGEIQHRCAPTAFRIQTGKIWR